MLSTPSQGPPLVHGLKCNQFAKGTSHQILNLSKIGQIEWILKQFKVSKGPVIIYGTGGGAESKVVGHRKYF